MCADEIKFCTELSCTPQVDTIHIVLQTPPGNNLDLLGYLPGVIDGTADVVLIINGELPEFSEQPKWLKMFRSNDPLHCLLTHGIMWLADGNSALDPVGFLAASLRRQLMLMESDYMFATITYGWPQQRHVHVPSITERIALNVVEEVMAN
jgi:hypothetical protein